MFTTQHLYYFLKLELSLVAKNIKLWMSIVESFGGLFTLSSSSALLTICFVVAMNENLSSSKFIALSNAFMNCTSFKNKIITNMLISNTRVEEKRINRGLQKGKRGLHKIKSHSSRLQPTKICSMTKPNFYHIILRKMKIWNNHA